MCARFRIETLKVKKKKIDKIQLVNNDIVEGFTLGSDSLRIDSFSEGFELQIFGMN